MTGQFTSKLEATVTLMMRIMLKMKLTKHPLWDGSIPLNNMNAMKLYEVLGKIRYKTWYCGMFATPSQQRGEILPYRLDKIISPHDEICKVEKIIEQIREVYDGDHVEFRPWDIFNILTVFLVESRDSLGKVVAEALLGELRMRLTCSKDSWLWKNMIDMLNGGLVPFVRVVEVLCDGNLYQDCHWCDKRVNVVDVGDNVIIFTRTAMMGLSIPFLENVTAILLFDDEPTLLFCAGVPYVVCGMSSCNMAFGGFFSYLAKALVEMNNTFDKLSVEYRGDLCDYCGGFNQQTMKGSRCAGCKTKVYCSMNCYRKDTVHHNLCQKGEKRKKKKGAMRRRELARTCYLRSVSSN